MNITNFRNCAIAVLLASFAITACNNQNSDNSTSVDTAALSAMPSDSIMRSPSDTITTSGDSGANSMKTNITTTPNKKKYKASVSVMPAHKSTTFKAGKNGVYEYAEEMPSFPGGQSALETYINDNFEYPVDFKDGKVNVKFTVDDQGKIKNAEVTGNKLSKEINDEAVKVVSSMPDWTPGKIKGKAVPVSLTLPIVIAAANN